MLFFKMLISLIISTFIIRVTITFAIMCQSNSKVWCLIDGYYAWRVTKNMLRVGLFDMAN